ncbi:polysaccharide biosynthesis protein [Sedimenticola hydrogenitrophicus]|uniref:polysaccharide biosynthesis protein n=1 Tax=Sedimenticola hydrogenitrophicus TaxID=2967975 RepID=UPI0023AFF7F5|nr:nucleoside-diphosphate sugar epimerase/dehydratase [Sedimenticola hydrogenitrophicus]
MTLEKLAVPVLALPRTAKRALVLVVDICLCVLTVWLAFFLRLEEWVRFSGEGFFQPQWAVLTSVVLAVPLFVTHGFYRVIFRYSALAAIGSVMRAFGLYGLLYATLITAVGLPGVPRSIGIIQPLLLLLAVGASRALARFWLGGLYKDILHRMNLPKALIYGAGTAGRQLAVAMANSQEMRVAGFLDDDDRLHGHVLNGLPIYSPDDLAGLVETIGIRTVLLAMPTLSRRRRNEILDSIRKAHAHVVVRTLPRMTDLAEGRVTTSDLRELDVDDLLGREPVSPNHILLVKNISGNVVLVTGAGGSIGSELCRQIIKLKPARLLLVEISEFALYAIHSELEMLQSADGRDKPHLIVPLLASVQDEERIREIIDAWQPDTIYHAAAYKHVPMVEHNLAEGVKNNVLGTLITAQAAIEKGVSDFVLISTDKAVRPANVMGASKRLAEMCLQALSQRIATGSKQGAKKTTLSMVRFGNVLGSSGSVIPKFRKQIRDGGPITLTHPEINRFFMTIPEAAQLVIQAGAMAKGGDVFVLDMGEPIRIVDLARRMVELSGLMVRDEQNPDGDIEISITGLRPGEKLYEELLIGDDPQPTVHSRIQRARDPFIPWSQLETDLNTLRIVLGHNNIDIILALLRKLVAGYQPTNEIVDWVYNEQLLSADGQFDGES